VGVGPDGVPEMDWVPIPGGKVVLEGSAGKAQVAAFEMARYPVTNAQFQAVAEDGYRDPRWWQDMPDDANDGPAESRWPEASHPRVEVSWYEAVDFCRWLSHRLGFEVRLPTELEWQQAATGGDPRNVYPWGPAWDAARCNSAEGALNRTTAVGLYPAGTSPPGVLDLAGNIWEWCLNKYEKPTELRIDWRAVRGGSWDLTWTWGACRAPPRDSLQPGDRDDGVGFRVVRPLSPDGEMQHQPTGPFADAGEEILAVAMGGTQAMTPQGVLGVARRDFPQDASVSHFDVRYPLVQGGGVQVLLENGYVRQLRHRSPPACEEPG
jgi:formylglycine-generating enzyme required for sulfatase activity